MKVSLAIVGILLLLAILARVGQQNPPQQTVPARAAPLPLQPSDLLSAYNPRPNLLAVTDKGTGHAVETYQGKFHKLELEEEDGQLVRAAMIFDKSEVTNNPAAGVAAPFWMGIFVMKAGRIKDNLKGWMEQLGLNDAWSPSPSQIVVNGVEIRRYVEGSSLILEAVAAGTARVTSAAGEPHAESPQACSIADEPHISWKIQERSDFMKKEDRIFGWTFSRAVIPRQVAIDLLCASTLNDADSVWKQYMYGLGNEGIRHYNEERGYYLAQADEVLRQVQGGREVPKTPNSTSETPSDQSENSVSPYEAQLRSMVVTRGYQPTGKTWRITATRKATNFWSSKHYAATCPTGTVKSFSSLSMTGSLGQIHSCRPGKCMTWRRRAWVGSAQFTTIFPTPIGRYPQSK